MVCVFVTKFEKRGGRKLMVGEWTNPKTKTGHSAPLCKGFQKSDACASPGAEPDRGGEDHICGNDGVGWKARA